MRFVRKNNKAMQRYRILCGNPICEKPQKWERIHYCQRITM